MSFSRKFKRKVFGVEDARNKYSKKHGWNVIKTDEKPPKGMKFIRVNDECNIVEEGKAE